MPTLACVTRPSLSSLHHHSTLHRLTMQDMTPDTADQDSSARGNVPIELIAREVARRRTFGIISHPDAGKTTLTEKLLLFSGAI